MVNYKLSNMLKLMLKMNSLKDLVRTNLLVKPLRSMEMANKKNSAMLKMRRNSLKVLVRTNPLVKPLRLMEMANKKNSAMPKMRRNSLKVLVRTNLLVRPLKLMEMENKKSTAMLKQKENGKLKTKIFLWLKLSDKKLLSNLLVLRVPLFQNLKRPREEITTQSKEPKI